MTSLTRPQASDTLGTTGVFLDVVLDEYADLIEANEAAAAAAQTTANAALPKAGGTMTGALVLAGAPTVDLHAATKKYVDDRTPTSASVTTGQTTTSASFTDLATVLSVTVTVPASGVVEVTWDAHARNSSAGAELIGSVALSGANTVTASDDHSFYLRPPTADYITSVTKTHLFTGLTPGSTTFTVKYRVGGGTGTFSRRQLIVRPGG